MISGDIKIDSSSLSFRKVLTLSAPQCASSDHVFGRGFDASLARILIDFKLGRLQQSQKRYHLLLRELQFYPERPLVKQETKLTALTAPLLIFELLFKMSNNENPPEREVWRYCDTIALFDPDDIICHGAIYNLLLMLFLRRGDLVAAEELAHLALNAYTQCGSAYLQGFVHLHLAYIHMYSGMLHTVPACLDAARDAFLASSEAHCECAMVEATRLWLALERDAALPDPEKLSALKRPLISGGFWPETILVFANLQLKSELLRDSENASLLHSALEVVLRTRGMTQILPAMQLMREESLLSQRAAESKGAAKPLAIAERQLFLLSPGLAALELNWGAAHKDVSLQLPRMRALQAFARGKTYLGEKRFDLAAPEFFAGLAIVENTCCMYLLQDVGKPVAAFLSQCRARKRFIEQARHYQNTLFSKLKQKSIAPKHPIALTASEFGVLVRLPLSTSNKAIARDLGVTERTIKFHLSNIYRKLGVKGRRDAIETASAKGWINPDQDSGS